MKNNNIEAIALNNTMGEPLIIIEKNNNLKIKLNYDELNNEKKNEENIFKKSEFIDFSNKCLEIINDSPQVEQEKNKMFKNCLEALMNQDIKTEYGTDILLLANALDNENMTFPIEKAKKINIVYDFKEEFLNNKEIILSNCEMNKDSKIKEIFDYVLIKNEQNCPELIKSITDKSTKYYDNKRKVEFYGEKIIINRYGEQTVIETEKSNTLKTVKQIIEKNNFYKTEYISYYENENLKLEMVKGFDNDNKLEFEIKIDKNLERIVDEDCKNVETKIRVANSFYDHGLEICNTVISSIGQNLKVEGYLEYIQKLNSSADKNELIEKAFKRDVQELKQTGIYDIYLKIEGKVEKKAFLECVSSFYESKMIQAIETMENKQGKINIDKLIEALSEPSPDRPDRPDKRPDQLDRPDLFEDQDKRLNRNENSIKMFGGEYNIFDFD